MITLQADLIRRLNVILGLPKKDLEGLDQTQWNNLRDEIYWAVFGETREPASNGGTLFDTAATPDGLRAAQEGLKPRLWIIQSGELSKPVEGSPASFDLAAQQAFLTAGRDGFSHRYISSDCPTMIYNTLIYLLEKSGIKQSDVLTCANNDCQRVFVPLRKPHKGQKSFCSQKCGNLISAREYRKNKAEELREKEQERNHKKYKAKVEARRGRPTRVQSRPHKPK